MIPPHSLIVARRHRTRTRTALARILAQGGGLLILDHRTVWRQGVHAVGGAIALVPVRPPATGCHVGVVTCYIASLANGASLAAVVGLRHAVVVRLRVRGDDVPGVQQARQEAEAA
jgi:hypothetical protein